MKKKVYTLLLALSLIRFIHSAYAQENYQPPRLDHPDSWTIIMLPDLQNYAKWNRNQPIFDLMVAWIEDHIDSLNIQIVVAVGDLIQNNERIVNDFDGDQSTQHQWESISNGFSRLDGKVPYIAATGNHDYSIDREGNRTSRYSEFFTVDRNWLNQKILVQNSRNEQVVPTLENSAYEIKNLNGKDYLFMTVEYGPRDTVIRWAKRVVGLDQYKDHRIILTTHMFLNARDERTSNDVTWLYWEPYTVNNKTEKSSAIKLPDANNGQQIWDKLVQPASNIELILCGHISGEGYRSDHNVAGKAVHQILFDAQSMGGGHRNGNGGDGWLRILEFYPDNRTVNVKTFSPLFAISPTTREYAWKKDERNEFSFQFRE